VEMLDSVRTALEGRLASVRADILALETSLTDSTTGGISSMELDTGEARQKVVLKNSESVARTLRNLYALEEWLLRRLGGGGIVSIVNRRKS
jgi:hypothetical protein